MTESLMELYLNIWEIAWGTWIPKLIPYVLGLLWTTSLIAFAIGCKDLIVSGGLQIEGIIALFVRFAFLSGMMHWLLSSPSNLTIIPNSLEQLGGYISGRTLSFGELIISFNALITPILAYYQELSWFTEPGLCIVSCILVFFINCLCTLFVVTVLLVKLETVFITIGGAFTAAFFVLGYFRDIFMGYIKALAMNGIKLLLLTLCLGLIIEFMSGWGANLQVALESDNGIYDTAIPMTFCLMAFYIILKSVPQYAVAILTGHASADGGMARAAVAAGIGATSTVFNVANTTASTVKNAAQAYQAYSKTVESVKDAGGSGTKARGMGAWEALKTFTTAPLTGGLNSGNTKSSRNSGKTDSPSGVNEMKPGGALDPFKAQESYNQDMGGKK